MDALFFLGASPRAPLQKSRSYEGPMGPTNSPSPTIPVHFLEGALSLSTIDVGDTTITITNLAPSGTPFCSTASPCSDIFTGFGFQFSSGVNITGVTVDPASAPASGRLQVV